MLNYSFEPIGWIRTPFRNKFGIPRQGRLAPSAKCYMEWKPGSTPEQWIDGLEGFSHVWLISIFHQHLNEGRPTKIFPPRMGGKRVGVLASRAPHRPNMLGLSLARLVLSEGKMLILSEVDLLDQTPILDIKPYLPEVDSAPLDEVKTGWVQTHPWNPLPVEFKTGVIHDLEVLLAEYPAPIMEPLEFSKLLVEMLQVDPRALADRVDKIDLDTGKPRQYWFQVHHIDVGFYFENNIVIINYVRLVDPKSKT